MTTNYDSIATEYQRAKQQPWRMHIEHFTLFKLLGDLHGKSVADLACGEGFYTRSIKRSGASRVVGVDISQGMITLAQREEAENHLEIDYKVQDVKELALNETFDVVVAAYLLNYAKTYEQLLEMCTAIFNHLKPGCRFIAVNNNPRQSPAYFSSTYKYGFIKKAQGPIVDGTPVNYTFFLDNKSVEITNYQLSAEAHELAFKTAGFQKVIWHRPELSSEIVDATERKYWSDFFHNPSITFIECVK